MPCDAKVAALDAKISALEAKLAAGGSPTPGKPADAQSVEAPTPGKPAAAQSVEAPKGKVLAAKCSVCHDDKVAAAKGGKLTLFSNGAPTLWTSETTGKVLKAVSSGKMPKGEKLSPEEFASVAQELFDLNSK